MQIEFNSYIQESDKTDLIQKEVDNFLASERFDFVKTLSDKKYQNQCHTIFERFKDRSHFVQIGIGGSSLGPEMLISALSKNTERTFHFINNIDPDKTAQQINQINFKDALFYVVSKSGGTAETLASFAIMVNELKSHGVKESELANYFVFASDPSTSQLRELGDDLGITTLDIPTNVGGRFSVLTPVGLLPALFAEIDIEELCRSAFSFGSELSNLDSFKKAVSMILNHHENGYDQTVFMPYSSRLRDLSFWFIQLWAESLGKKDKDGKRVGLTPIPSYGATDQHSQMQLFMEGPLNKVMLLINIKESEQDLKLENQFDHPKLQKLSGFTLKNLMDSEFFGTKKALEEQNVPHIVFNINKLNEENLAKLVIFFEFLTAVTGFCLKIDPFNQPGVEAGKIYSFEWLDNL
ncbi:glucose-6-phosphate isomerase [Halobacteriovorax sp.]|uniref:glucose-6-phosphate isomerase n=1 Tax=Halobacteriovorax sp. TaxID=2020862 RepID=UPI003AF256A9